MRSRGGRTTPRKHTCSTASTSIPNGDITKPLVPVLASGLPVRGAKNKREFVVPLRKGVKFHDGTPFNAGSVLFDYVTDIDKTQQFYDAKAIFAGVNFILGVTKIDALDEHHVKFTLNRPLGDFTSQLVTFAGLMSSTAIRKNGLDSVALNPVGTGPYRFVEAIKGDHITLEANDDYFLGRPKIDRIVVRAIPDYAALTAALLSGEVDVSWFVNVNDVPAFQKNSNLNVAFRSGVATGYVEFNAMGANGVNTFKDPRVRQAALHALDKRKLINAGLHGYGQVGAGLNPQPSAGYQPSLRDYYKFDANQAKTLLNAAGGPRDVTLSVPSNLYWPLAGQIIQSDWNAVGLKTNLNVIDAAAFGSTMTQGKHDVFIWDATPVLFQPWALYNTLLQPDERAEHAQRRLGRPEVPAAPARGVRDCGSGQGQELRRPDGQDPARQHDLAGQLLPDDRVGLQQAAQGLPAAERQVRDVHECADHVTRRSPAGDGEPGDSERSAAWPAASLRPAVFRQTPGSGSSSAAAARASPMALLRSLLSDPTTAVSLVFLVVVVLSAVLAPLVAPYSAGEAGLPPRPGRAVVVASVRNRSDRPRPALPDHVRRPDIARDRRLARSCSPSWPAPSSGSSAGTSAAGSTAPSCAGST